MALKESVSTAWELYAATAQLLFPCCEFALVSHWSVRSDFSAKKPFSWFGEGATLKHCASWKHSEYLSDHAFRWNGEFHKRTFLVNTILSATDGLCTSCLWKVHGRCWETRSSYPRWFYVLTLVKCQHFLELDLGTVNINRHSQCRFLLKHGLSYQTLPSSLVSTA